MTSHLPRAVAAREARDRFAVLDEIVGQLCERIELLEARELLARTAVSARPGRRRSSP